jgi:putative flippase GtrA
MTFRDILQKVLSVQFVRFAIVGVIATGVHYAIYYALYHVMNVNVAYTIGYVLSWFMNFYLTAHFTFRTQTNVKRGLGFAVSHGVNYLLHILFLNIVLWCGVPKAYAPIPVFCIVIPINFLLVRYVFSSRYFR